MDDHGHDHGHEEVAVTETSLTVEAEPSLLVNTVEREVHDHSGTEGLFEVMFGFEHVVAEFFWNAVFILGTLLFTKAVALRKIHKYVDDRHGVEHEKNDY